MTIVHWKTKYSSAFDESYASMATISWGVRSQAHIWSPPTDLFENENHYVVRVEIAGMHKNAFEINIEDNFLIIKGKRTEPTGKKAFHQMEVRFGEFSSIVEIPGSVDESKAEAEYHDGFLTVILPKFTIFE
ncbi:MAG TPA: Hsp20/alpha crystallin family protein [Anaerolineales bacterium]|nr:Hsp20/alpha crystallin family protein [Anaerolineales bacterium]